MEKPKGSRFNRYFVGVCAQDSKHWYDYTLKKWVSEDELNWAEHDYSNFYSPCRTIKAFKRYLKKHSKMKGKLLLRSKYIGYDVWG